MMKFRYDINALRAIAVVSVLLFHLNIPFVSGGFVGVDIFFVISGYLMTKIILFGIQNNEFSILNFYAKRFFRIVPALLFLVFIVTIAGFFIYLPNQYKENETNASASLLFYSNILYWKQSNYFDSASINNVFLHTWSLSLEWQFYIIYPIVISLVAWPFKNKKILIRLFLIITVLFLLVSILVTYKSPVASFFLMPTRVWELLIGGLAFIAEGKIKSKILLIVSYVVVILSTVFLNEKMLWPGVFTLLPVVGTFLVIIINDDNYPLIKNNVVQFLGRISYSLYLWHWPLIVFARYMGFQLSTSTTVVLLISSLLVAFLSFKFIESVKWSKIVWLLVPAIGLCILTFFLSFHEANRRLFKRESLKIAEYLDDNRSKAMEEYSTNKCLLVQDTAKLENFKKRDCLCIDSEKKNILILGDSHAAKLVPAFRATFASRNINVLQATASWGYPFCSFTNNHNAKFVNTLYHYIYYDFLVKNKKYINGVIIEGNWWTDPTSVLSQLPNVLDYLKKLNIPVVIIGQNNVFTISYPTIMAKWNENKTDLLDFYSEKKAFTYNEQFKKAFKPYYVDIYYYSNIPKLDSINRPFMEDSHHLSGFGANLVVKKIFKDTIFQARILSKL